MARKWKNKELELSLSEMQSLIAFVQKHQDDLFFEDVILKWSQRSGIGVNVFAKLVILDKKNIPNNIDVTDWEDITDYSNW